jgi:hypothetical protein
MDESSLAALFEQAVAGRPPTPLLVANSLHDGRKIRMRHQIKVAVAALAGIGIVAAIAPTAFGALSQQAPATARVGPETLFIADANGTVTSIRVGSSAAGRPIRLRAPVPQLPVYGPVSAMAAAANGKVVYVTSGDTVSPIYTSTDTAGAPIRAASQQLTSLVVAPNGRIAYAVEPRHGVVPINLVTRRPGKLIRDIGAAQLTMTPDGSTLYLADGGGVAPIRTATNTRLGPIQHTVGVSSILGFSPDSKTVYLGGNDLYPVSTATNTVRAPIRIPGTIDQLVISANGKIGYAFVWPSHPAPGNEASVPAAYPVNFATGAVGKAILLPHHGFMDGIAITPNGRTLYLWGALPGRKHAREVLVPVRTATNALLTPISLGSDNVSYLRISPDGSMAYVVFSQLHSSRYYALGIPTATNKPGKPIRLDGTHPVALVFAP